MKKYIITGATGMVGSYLHQNPHFQKIEAILPTRGQMDLNNPGQCHDFIMDTGADIVVHLSAETNVDLCETDRDGAEKRNYFASQAIANACKLRAIPMVYMSTAYIFGGEKKQCYNENDTPQPLNHYGMTKWLGEEAVRDILPDNHIIIRPSWMVGGGPARDNKFVGKIMEKLRGGVRELQIVDDQFGSLSYSKNVVSDIFSLINANFRGVFHSASNGVISRLDMARFMVEYLGLNVTITPCSANQFARKTPLADSYGISTIHPQYNQNHHDWQADLAEYLKEFLVNGL